VFVRVGARNSYSRLPGRSGRFGFRIPAPAPARTTRAPALAL